MQEVLDAHVAWVSEFDKGPSKILAQRFPDAPNLGDITKIDWTSVNPVDIITGGSPCQDLSHAGKRLGMKAGTRSGLWVSMLQAIKTIKPKLVIWENVGGAFSAEATSEMEQCPGCVGDGTERPVLRALGRVLGDLTEAGYDAEWHSLRAADIGAPHGRLRVFVIAWPREAGKPRLAGRALVSDTSSVRLEERRLSSRSSQEITAPHRDLSLLPTPQTSDTNGAGPKPGQWADRWQLRDLVLRSVQERRGMTLFPTPRATDGTKGGPNQRGSKGDLMLPSAVHHLLPTSKAGDADWGLPRTSGRPPEKSTHLATRLHYTDFGEYAPAIARWEAIRGPAPEPTLPTGKDGKAQLSAAFVEWMMGLPPGWVTDTDTTRNEQLKALGNGVVPAQAAEAIRRALSVEGAFLLEES